MSGSAISKRPSISDLSGGRAPTGGPDWLVALRKRGRIRFEELGLPTTREEAWRTTSLASLTGHGSDRRFWRLETGDWSAVAMQSPPGDPEFARAVNIARYLHEQGLISEKPTVESLFAESVRGL